MNRLAMPLASMVAVLGFLGASTPSEPPDDFQKRGEEIVATVRDRFFDRDKAESWSKAHSRYAERARTEPDFVALTRAALSDLHASHTAYYTPDDRPYHDLLSIFRAHLKPKDVSIDSIGVDITAEGFVRVVFAGGPGEKAGLRRGDKILKAGGEAFEPVGSFRGRSGIPVSLTVQSREAETPREVAVTPRRIDIADEWLEAQTLGAKLIERNGKTMAYMPFFSAAGKVPQDTLREAISDKFAKADALILDFRNGWGGADPTFLNLFDKTPPSLEQIGRGGARTRYDRHWRKPLVVLINGGTKSGKEVVVHAIRKHKIGTLVGERTGGAVLAGSPFLLEGGLMYLAVADILVDGKRLEGKGVAPDREVHDHLEFAEGADPQLEIALELAAN